MELFCDVLDLFLRRGSDTQCGDDRLAAEEVLASRVNDAKHGEARSQGSELRAKELVQVAGPEAHLSAGRVRKALVILRSKLGILALNESAEERVASLRRQFSWGHAKIGTDDGVEPESIIRNLRVGTRKWAGTSLRSGIVREGSGLAGTH